MIYITGDTHSNFERFFLPKIKFHEDDYIIICGDFGGVWDGSYGEIEILNNLSKLPFTILFVDGNHENFDILNSFPVQQWNGGNIHKIRNNIIHLMRGQVFTIEGKKFFTLGGGKSHDIQDGILDPKDANFERKYAMFARLNKMFRIKGLSWWPEEMPSKEEYDIAKENLEKNNYEVDYIISHCGPNSIIDIISKGLYEHDELTTFLQEVIEKCKFSYHFYGHYHDNRIIGQHIMLYHKIISLNSFV